MLEAQTRTLTPDDTQWEAPARRHPERRKPVAPEPGSLRSGLTPAQRATLETMEQFQWILHFVRRPLFQAPIPVLFNREATRFVVILEDGGIDESPTLKLRN